MSDRESTSGRRTFLRTGAAALSAAALPLATPGGVQAQVSSGKMKAALVGTGSRGSGMWGKNVVDEYGDVVEFVGLCDINSKRMTFVKQYMGVTCPTFTDFDEMVNTTRPDTVIVTTTDCFHAKYACRAMELGCDVILEKPMATDEKMCQQIIETERRTGKKVTITFNARYGAPVVRIKSILESGELGRITSVDLNWYLDTSHGTKGRLDARVYSRQPWDPESLADFRITELFGKTRSFKMTNRDRRGHGGADPKLQDRIFRNAPDPLNQAAGTRDGALSIMIGIAARRSIEQQRPVFIEELVKI